jgi:hypothetical protein
VYFVHFGCLLGYAYSDEGCGTCCVSCAASRGRAQHCNQLVKSRLISPAADEVASGQLVLAERRPRAMAGRGWRPWMRNWHCSQTQLTSWAMALPVRVGIPG